MYFPICNYRSVVLQKGRVAIFQVKQFLFNVIILFICYFFPPLFIYFLIYFWPWTWVVLEFEHSFQDRISWM